MQPQTSGSLRSNASVEKGKEMAARLSVRRIHGQLRGLDSPGQTAAPKCRHGDSRPMGFFCSVWNGLYRHRAQTRVRKVQNKAWELAVKAPRLNIVLLTGGVGGSFCYVS